MKETPKDRALFLLSLLMIIIANFIFLPGAVILVIMSVVNIFKGEFMLSGIFIGVAVLCVILNRVIIKSDDQYEERRKREMEEYKQSLMKKLDAKSSAAKSGVLVFEYDGEEDVTRLSGGQLRTFNNDASFDVTSYDTQGKINEEVRIIERIYKDEKIILEGMRKRLLSYYQEEGENVSESDVQKIKIKELFIEREKGSYSFGLKGVNQAAGYDVTVSAGGKVGYDDYKFYMDFDY